MLDATPLPPCCTATAATVADQREDVTCRCGERYRWSGTVAVARVQVADERRLRPSTAPPEERRTHTEDAFTARLRRLVVDLRTAELDGAGAPAIQYRERVQTSGSSYDGPRIGAATVRTPVTDRLHALADRDPKSVRVLCWLRAQGNAYDLVNAGRASLVLVALARELGDVKQHIVWTREPKGAEVWARAALGRAMTAWWGEGEGVTVAR